ncbi:hypothetical protein H2200_002617 [Cladophialophora chaetospira]|uniref:Uncharacterized protein n=1 Tax=Cladophialophora chaetospira TaxID=386627 RepID=A0AA39CNQ9_9EURO|nr:hypothetical protein H2200_002617 [Cladophialophora chaetospira]
MNRLMTKLDIESPKKTQRHSQPQQTCKFFADDVLAIKDTRTADVDRMDFETPRKERPRRAFRDEGLEASRWRHKPDVDKQEIKRAKKEHKFCAGADEDKMDVDGQKTLRPGKSHVLAIPSKPRPDVHKMDLDSSQEQGRTKSFAGAGAEASKWAMPKPQHIRFDD